MGINTFDSDIVSKLEAKYREYSTETIFRTRKTSDFVLEEITAYPYGVSYTCLMIPRFIKHFLTGDLVEFLYQEMKNICIAYGWRLDYLDVRPDYLQWIIVVNPADSPSNFIRITQHSTSKEIFREFPRFRKENKSNNFWASQYLVLAGSQPYPLEMIQEFIRMTRKQQGQ